MVHRPNYHSESSSLGFQLVLATEGFWKVPEGLHNTDRNLKLNCRFLRVPQVGNSFNN